LAIVANSAAKMNMIPSMYLNSPPGRVMLMLRGEQKEGSRRIHHVVVVVLNSPIVGA